MFKSAPVSESRPLVQQKSIGGIGFDRLTVFFCSWLVGGVYLDGWAHSHDFVDNSFFTIWHAVLYSGYLATALLLLSAAAINVSRGSHWLRALPEGYSWSAVGIPIFALAGVGDMFWHILFGFENGIEPLLSPTHLMLALGGTLIVSGPLRAIWLRASRNDEGLLHRWAALFPGLLSLLLVTSVITFFLSFANPITHAWLATGGTSDSQESLGVTGILLYSIVMMGAFLYSLRRWRLPVGTFTLFFTINTALLSVFDDEYRLIPAALLAGLLADLLYYYLQPSGKRVDQLRLFSLSVPIIYYLCYFGTIALTSGVNWSIHLWLGVSVMSGVIGLLLSYLLNPPPAPAEESFE